MVFSEISNFHPENGLKMFVLFRTVQNGRYLRPHRTQPNAPGYPTSTSFRGAKRRGNPVDIGTGPLRPAYAGHLSQRERQAAVGDGSYRVGMTFIIVGRQLAAAGQYRKKTSEVSFGGLAVYLAYSTALVSRMTLTLIWPGYSSSASIFLAMSRASRIMLSSVTTSGLTMMRTSRPAWMA